MKKKILLLVNSVSGTRNAVNQLFNMIRFLTEKDCLVTVYPIVPELGLVSENITSFVNENDFDVIACCGGDGTMNHLINVVMNEHIACPIGYIPTGSTNDFSKSMNGGRSLTLEEQCSAIAEGNTFAYDVGKVNDRYFNYIAAFGAFTKVSYDTPQKWKNVLGYGAYVLNMVGNIPGGITYRRHVKYEYDNGIGEGDFIFGAICNTTSVAGVKSPLVQNAKMNDGLFEVILVMYPNNIIDLNQIVQKMASGNTDDQHVIRFTTSHIRMTFDQPVAWTLDGEEYETEKSVNILNNRQEIKLCVKENVDISNQKDSSDSEL